MPESTQLNNALAVAVFLVSPTSDSDGDGMSDRMEMLAGTDPMNATSILITLPPIRGNLRGVEVCWASVLGKVYSLERTENLGAGPGFLVVQSNLLGQISVTCHTDLTATNRGPYFYRGRVEP